MKKPRKAIPVEYPPKFEPMMNFTAIMALGFEVPTVCSSASQILFCCGTWVRLWHFSDLSNQV